MIVGISGYSGFLGKNLLLSLINRNEHSKLILFGRKKFYDIYPNALTEESSDSLIKIKFVYTDFLDKSSIKNINKYNIDTFYHFASSPLVRDNPTNLYKLNYLGTKHLLDNLSTNTKIVFASSATVYGQKYGCEDSDLAPNSTYAVIKIACEDLIRSFTDRHLILRFTANVGQFSTHGLVHDLVNKIKNSDKIILFGEKPGSTKPYTHVLDTIRAIHFLSDYKGTFNVGVDDNISVEEVTKIIMAHIKIDKPIEWTGKTWEGDDNMVLISDTKLKNLGFYFIYSTSAKAVEYHAWKFF